MKKIFLFIIFFCKIISSQELLATVIVNYEKLPVFNKENLNNFKTIIEDYLNKTRFTGEKWDYPKIKCSFNIFFLSASDEVTYNAQAVITSLRQTNVPNKELLMLSIMDNNWNFTYEKNQSIYFDPNNFESIRSFLDFYAYIIIGIENDSWSKLGGTDFFSKAYSLVNLGVSSRNSKGWEKTVGSYSRFNLIENLLDEKYRPIRESYFDYHKGIHLFVKDKKAAQEKIVNFLKVVESQKSKMTMSSIYLKVFFDAKSGEIIEYLKDYPDKNIFKLLKSIDPSHTAKYDEMLR